MEFLKTYFKQFQQNEEDENISLDQLLNDEFVVSNKKVAKPSNMNFKQKKASNPFADELSVHKSPEALFEELRNLERLEKRFAKAEHTHKALPHLSLQNPRMKSRKTDFANNLDFACPFCQFTADVQGLIGHVESTHRGDRTAVVCPICASRPEIVRVSNFLAHLRLRHNTPLPFSMLGLRASQFEPNPDTPITLISRATSPSLLTFNSSNPEALWEYFTAFDEVVAEEPPNCDHCQLVFAPNETPGVLPCGHLYHDDCFTAVLVRDKTPSCPKCNPKRKKKKRNKHRKPCAIVDIMKASKENVHQTPRKKKKKRLKIGEKEL